MADPFARPGEPGVYIEDEVREPRKYKVLLHNDDYTTMEFVVRVLTAVFSKSEVEAMDIMLKIHNEGIGVCGIFTAEVAETKVALVRQLAARDGFPLKCTMEEV
ncbi:ATP-dependent Clp protease adaptor ClpS [Desulfovibrio ferrophilus]|uniref:ATP-dependent Clp protease adapter protein ClpS n=1 Tax=Desulfovibrio ferrophilus TaxID=241368 RepID=A0A2Z6AW77_9BACT|nr:ATP-dependent Clp protease adaptor ClpS [Desulfovibrio ferrophilus]BBD07504.1 ATP-dependent Clp protease adapter protein clpS [Desulfovibrio ferrophilus]